MVKTKATWYRLLMLEVLICFAPVILSLFFGVILSPILLPFWLTQIIGILTGTVEKSLLTYLLPLSSLVFGLVGLASLIYVVRSLRRNYLNPNLLPRIRIGFFLGLWAVIQIAVIPYVPYLLTPDNIYLEEFSLMKFFLGTLFSLCLPLLCGMHIMYLGEKLAKIDNAEH